MESLPPVRMAMHKLGRLVFWAATQQKVQNSRARWIFHETSTPSDGSDLDSIREPRTLLNQGRCFASVCTATLWRLFNMYTSRQLLSLILLATFAAGAVAEESVPPSTPPVAAEIGAVVQVPSFKDIRYLPRTLDDLGKHKACLLYFFSNTCPVAQRYTGVLLELEKVYAPQGVQFVAVNASPADSIMDMAQYGLDYGITFPIVKDTHGDVSRALGITRTPEVALLDADHRLVYRGRIDDQFRLGGVRPSATRDDLKVALDEMLAGKPVSVPTTKSEGCSLTFPSIPTPEEPVTFSEHIAPIINKHCISCHHEGGGAPFGLETYGKNARRADMLAEVVAEGRMPPWYAHPDHGEFSNTKRLTEKEKLLVQQWVKSGTPEGDPALAPPLPELKPASEWNIEPDLILEAEMPNGLPATGFIPYRYVLFPHKFEQDTYLEAIEIKSSNPAVMHHSNLFYTPGGLEFQRSQHFITGMVPGGLPSTVPPGMGICVPKGATLGLQIHYVTTGKKEVDTPLVALRYCRNPVRHKTHYNILDDGSFKIPPFAPAYETRQSATMDDEVTLLAMFGHMHLRGKNMRYIAHLPDGTQETLLSLPNYNFDWQLTYYLEPGTKILPKGTRVECIAQFDNSAFNPYNPAPDKEVTYGKQTVDEMSQGFIFYVKNNEEVNYKIDPNTGWVLEETASAR